MTVRRRPIAHSTTKRSRRRTGRGRWSAVVLAIAGALVLSATTGVSHTADTDDQLSFSMIELTGDSESSRTVSMSDLRDDVLGSSASSNGGAGIDVALIDSGVAPVDGLDGDKVLHGPDLSNEGGIAQVAYLDTYGHGTHMAGIIAGDRSGALGIAPGARLVSVKVAGAEGVTTVPQVIAAIDWVIDHRDSDGLNIRVLNLSLGQAGVSTNDGDVLSAAVERAWDAGIVVVVAAGNRGTNQPHLDSPAVSPYVVAVGASDSASDDDDDLDERSVPSWSAQGNGVRSPDIVAPGRSIASYRVPGSTIDNATPSAVYDTHFYRGSGTSQSAAVVSGLAAVLLAERPSLTPDEVRDTIEERAIRLEDVSSRRQGDGHIRGRYTVNYSPITGQSADNGPRAGYNGGMVAPTADQHTWSGGEWSGASWSGATWSGATWSGASWSGASWSGASWSGASWSGASWSGASWSGASWSGASWSGATWSGATWSGASWSMASGS